MKDTLQIPRAVVKQAPRYHVRQDGFWWWCVKAEDGTRTLLKAGTKLGAERLAATLEAEFQTGVFVGQQAALQPQAEPKVEPETYWMIECRHGFTGWWKGSGQVDCRLFDKDPARGKRFPTKQEAEGAIQNSCQIATEHMGCSKPQTAEQDIPPGYTAIDCPACGFQGCREQQAAAEPITCQYCHSDSGEVMWHCNNCGNKDQPYTTPPATQAALTAALDALKVVEHSAAYQYVNLPDQVDRIKYAIAQLEALKG